MRKQGMLLVLIMCIGIMPLEIYNAAETNSEAYSVSGTVYDENGNLAGSTSIQINGFSSAWTVDGTYEYSDIPEGDYWIRAYYMNNGHTVSYRKIIIDSDINLNWVVDNNWATISSNDNAATFEIIGDDVNSVKSHANLVEFGPYKIGDYYNITAINDSGASHTIMFQMKAGSSSDNYPNHFVLDSGTNSYFGYVRDMLDNPMPNVQVLVDNKTTLTNSDGFYLINGLNVGDVVNISAKQDEVELISQFTTTVNQDLGWNNLTSEIAPEMPDEPSFLTSSFDMQIDDLEEKIIRWTGGNYTDYYELSINGEIAYKGFQQQYVFNPNQVGSYELIISAVNLNGTTVALKSINVVVLVPSQTGFWDVGMSWEYNVDYTPASSNGTHTMTMTTIGTEIIRDAFGVEQECFLMNVVDEYDSDDRVRYYWIDSNNLMKIKTYSETSSYFVAGTMGWNYTTDDGDSIDLLSSDVASFNAHFNRTNIIGVPGHPDGYDDTMNLVTVTENVTVETPIGNFLTTYYKITDLTDNIDSWELWYNETVRNWIKVIDRLPGSHSESVEYLLSNFSGVPDKPQFVTESSLLGVNSYELQWGQFGRAGSYSLIENGNEIYNGNAINFQISDKSDGTYTYSIIAYLPSGSVVTSDAITLTIDYVVPAPKLNMPYTQNVSGDNQIMVEWSQIPNAVWYSLYHAGEDGSIGEIYNGSETSFLFEDLSDGQNRFRVAAGIANGKFSELSESSYVNYMQSDNDEEGLLIFLPFSNLVLLVFIAVLFRQNRRW
mgnify:CR=1 FL=1